MFCARFDLADVQLVIVAIVTNAEIDEPLALLARNSLSESRFRRDLGVAAGAANFVWGSGGHLESLRLVSSDNDVMMIGPGFFASGFENPRAARVDEFSKVYKLELLLRLLLGIRLTTLAQLRTVRQPQRVRGTLGG